MSKITQGWLWGIAALILLVLGFAFWWVYQPKPEVLQGQIEAQDYTVSSKMGGRIDQIAVRKGQIVTKGTLAFTLLSPELDAKLQQAQAGEAAAGALAQEVDKGARAQQISAARDQWLKAQSAAALYEKTFRRIDSLYRDGVVPLQKKDEAETRWRSAILTQNAAWQLYQLALEGARAEQKLAAHEKAKMAAGAVAEVQAYADELQVLSPAAGEVTQVLLQPGELAPQGFPVVTLTDMQDAWALFHVREDRLAAFLPGRELTLRLPALGSQSFRFRVSHVAVMGDFATWRATDSQQGFDLRSFEVEARPLTPIPNLRVGMSVLVDLPHGE
jgi:HlyD family secretion protein